VFVRIQDVDSELVWQLLTDSEKEDFHKMLGDGRIGHLLDTYTPWWKVSYSLSVVLMYNVHMHRLFVHVYTVIVRVCMHA